MKQLIAASAQPLKAIEEDFAVDSSGFSTGQFMRWFDVKYGTKKIAASGLNCIFAAV